MSIVLGQPPYFAPRAPGEFSSPYAIRVLLYIIAHDCCAPFSIDDLELALMRAAYHPSMIPTTIAAIRTARETIANRLKQRYAELQAPARQVEAPAAGQDTPNAGPMAPLMAPEYSPRPPAQAVNLPAFEF